MKHSILVTEVLHDTHDHALRFADADADGKQELSFDQFCTLMPEKVHNEFGTEKIRLWFDAADI
eukprot:CAMPEP_0174737686 /NCGR_PEP_ID=MMETSP1094-20130205/68722_1 /TAXON_ID=156173 /ORGANISM="Chrysochromulina brevifilum, Strain UTEX LB 985" /LENGTH=63 /DNA_ID=CAMNT_0015940955 /DNA_START=118 /DNA_END=306 /DNA_ORIENTATION=+